MTYADVVHANGWQPRGQQPVTMADFHAQQIQHAMAQGHIPLAVPQEQEGPSDEEAAQYAEQLEAYFDEVGLTETEKNIVIHRAIGGALVDENGIPDIDGAIEELQASRWERDNADYLKALPEDATSDDRSQWMGAKLQAQERADRDLQRAEGNDDRAWVREGREPEGRDEILAAGIERIEQQNLERGAA
jgi:hypothetical protein